MSDHWTVRFRSPRLEMSDEVDFSPDVRITVTGSAGYVDAILTRQQAQELADALNYHRTTLNLLRD